MFWPSRSQKGKQTETAEASENTVAVSAENENVTTSLPMTERQDTAHDKALRDLGFAGDREQTDQYTSGAMEAADKASTSAFSTRPEDVYDPATGALAGVVRSTPSTSWDIGSPASGASQTPSGIQIPRSVSGPAALGGPAPSIVSPTAKTNGNSEEIWNQLAKIRVLQSEIAKMHLALDKAGIVEGVKRGRTGTAGTSTGVPLRPEDAGRTGRDRAGSIPDLLFPAPEDEFARRKASIDSVISKVCPVDISARLA